MASPRHFAPPLSTSWQVATEIQTGTLIADFRVERLIGAGATGSVFLAEDVRSGTRVALKILAPELARDARFRERFLRESRIAADLHHPNVTRTLGSGEADGLLYLAMAYVDGSDLRDLLRRDGRFDPARAVAVVSQVAGALDDAHRRGLVHRDVKPGNILVADDPDGGEHAYICDFGLARHVSSVSSLTGERGFVGTIDYVPPEQIQGATLDGRADVYSLGCVLFELLTGERPFDRESELSVVFAHLNDPPPQVTRLRPELPAAFDDVVATALAKSPDGRFATCGELADAADAAIHGKTLRRGWPSRRMWLAAAALVAVAAAVGAILATHSGGTTHASAPTLPLRANAVNLISARTRRVTGHVTLGKGASSPFAVFDVVHTRGAAWILDAADRRLVRIDLKTRRSSKTVALPWPPADRIAVGGGFVWATQEGGDGVVGVDTRTGRIARRFNVSGGNGAGIAVGDGSLWLVQGTDVARIEPRRGRVLRRIVTRPGQEGTTNWLVFADGAVWAASADDGIIRKIDPVANRVVARNTLHGYIGDLAVGAGNVWVSVVQDGVVYQLSEDDLSVAGTRTAGPDPERLSLAPGSLWIANTTGRAISSLSGLSGARRELTTAERAQTVAYADGLVLAVAVVSPRPLPPIDGEEIRASTPRDVLSGDPQSPTNVHSSEVDYATCANLLGYPDAGGLAGASLRPDVAAAMPTASRDGRTYTFRIRRGFRFSPPSNEEVTAETFRRSIERAVSHPFAGFGDSVVGDIAGEKSFRAGNATHISGLVARGDTLQITLVKPSGSFLTRISLPFFCPVPRGTRKQPASHVPGDGPYYVASVATGRTVLLQNPNYGGSRPRRAARIVFESGTPTPQAVTLTDRGELDYLPPDFDSNSLLGVSGALDRRYGPVSAAARAGDERYLHLPIPAEDAVVFNATRPLFRDVRVRRAVEYALDRRRLSASYADLPTDGIVPPAVPGFGPAHVYPLTPDLVKAQRLAGHTRRRAVLYYCTNGAFGGTGHAHVAAIIRANLTRIGISVSIVTPPCSADNRYDAHSRQADLILTSTFSPILDPEAFLSQLLSHGQLGSALGSGLWTEPQFLARVRRAAAFTGSARGAAYRRLEQELLRAAPVAAFGSFYDGHYLSPHVGCRIVQEGANVIDLGMLCKRGTS